MPMCLTIVYCCDNIQLCLGKKYYKHMLLSVWNWMSNIGKQYISKHMMVKAS